MTMFVEQGWASFAIPCFSTIRSWLLRVGHFALTRPLDRTEPWLWLVDHTIQIGTQKILLILGCPMTQIPFGQRVLQLSDLQLVALVPMEKSNGASVETALEDAARRTGTPRQIVSDQGSDLRKGSADFQSYRSNTSYVPDAAHYGANLLEQAWEDQPRWQEFVKNLQDTSSQLRQTSSAYLLTPRLRPTARFMNVRVQLRFARAVLQHLDGPTPQTKAVESYGWLKAFRDELAIWGREHDLVQTTIDLVRFEGLHADTATHLETTWGEIGSRESTVRIAERLRDYVVRYRPTKAGERFYASTEILESSFGKLKRIEGQQNRAGVTGLVLVLGAMVGTCNASDLGVALDATPQKKVDNWVGRVLGHSVQWFRRQFFAATQAKQKQNELK